MNLLRIGKSLHRSLIENYSGVLPKNLIDNADNSISESLPIKINNIIKILNMPEGEDKYSLVSNADEAIELFENVNIQNSFDKAIAGKIIAVGGEPQEKPMSAKEVMEALRSQIKDLVDLLEIYNSLGKVTKKIHAVNFSPIKG